MVYAAHRHTTDIECQCDDCNYEFSLAAEYSPATRDEPADLVLLESRVCPECHSTNISEVGAENHYED